MTDQLEHDLRSMLAGRAEAVTADPAASEQTIADRLQTGDATLADVVPLAVRPARRRWLAAAAAAVVVIAGVAAVIVHDDDKTTLVTPSVDPDPVIFTAAGTAEDVARAYLVDRLDAAPAAIELRASDSIGAADAAGFDWTRTDVEAPTGGFVGLLERNGRWAVLEAFTDGPSIDSVDRNAASLTVHTTGPAGSYVQLSVHLLSGESLSAGGCGGEAVGANGPEEPTEPVTCSLVDEPIPNEVADDPLTIRFSVVTREGTLLTLEEQLLLAPGEDEDGREQDPTRSRQGEAAKDVAERVASMAFGDEYVTTGADDRDESTFVTMEGPLGTVTAKLWPDPQAGGWQLVSIASPALEPILDAGGRISEDGRLEIEVPVAGLLTVTGLDGALEPLGETTSTRVEPGGTSSIAGVEPWLEESRWVRVSILMDDGERLQLFAAA